MHIYPENQTADLERLKLKTSFRKVTSKIKVLIVFPHSCSEVSSLAGNDLNGRAKPTGQVDLVLGRSPLVARGRNSPSLSLMVQCIVDILWVMLLEIITKLSGFHIIQTKKSHTCTTYRLAISQKTSDLATLDILLCFLSY